jgi:integrase
LQLLLFDHLLAYATTIIYNDSLFTRIQATLGHKSLDKIEPKHLLAFYENLAEPGIRIDPNEKRRKEKEERLRAQGKEFPPKVELVDKPKADTLSSYTIRKHHILLNTLFNQAVKWNLIPSNPADRVDPPKVKHSKKAIYDDETTGRFLQALEGEESKHRLMSTGGLCREEIFGLEWRDVNFDTGALTIDRASIYVAGKGIITKDCKNTHRHWVISLPQVTLQLLKQCKAEQSAKRLELGGTGEGGKWIGADELENDRVFTTWNGAPAHPHSFNSWLRRFVTRAKLPPITPHLFRHMAATYLITAGTDIKTVSGKLGHAQTSTTMNIYSHLLKSAEQETADKMEAYLQQATEKAKAKQKKQAK